MTQIISSRVDYGYRFTNSTPVALFSVGVFYATSLQHPWMLFASIAPLPDRKTIFIQDLADGRVSLRSPLPVLVESWKNQTTVFSADTGDFSVGDDESSALDEFRAAVVELYFLLKSERDKLGALPMKHWRFLSSMIDEA